MTEGDLTPIGPDGSSLTPEEWDAVRRLRGERPAEPGTEWTPAEWRARSTDVDEPQATGQPLPPVEPTPPADETAPPVAETAAAAAPAEQPPAAPPTEDAPATTALPTWGGARERERTGTPALPAVAALVALAVVMAVLAALVGLKISDRHAHDSASTAALSAASSGVATVLSYNYRSLDHDFASAEALLTPSFRKAYVATTAKAVQPLAAKYKAVSTAQVSAAGVISATPSRAVVLVFVSQTVTNTQLSAPRLDRSRIQVELVHSHGNWLINKLTPL